MPSQRFSKFLATIGILLWIYLPAAAQAPADPQLIPPYAITVDASDVMTTGATLNGVVNAGGIATRVFFEWGTTTAYGNTSAVPGDSLRGGNDVDVSVALTGLTAGTTYNFRVFGVPVVGDTLLGSNRTFTTNRNPLVVNGISNDTIVLGQLPLRVDLNTVFSDPDGDILSYSAGSSNEAVAVAAVTGGNSLVVTGISSGTATITINADDGRGGSAADVFTVTVNAPPFVANQIPDLVLQVNEIFQRDLLVSPVVFDDPDDPRASLIFTATSDDPAIATANMTGSRLTVTLLQENTTLIRISANDGRGGSAIDSFAVSNNRPPQVDSTIADINLNVGETSEIVNLADIFSDPDADDSLIFSAVTSAPGVAIPSIVDFNQLSVTAIGSGSALITISAADGRGGNATVDFTVNVNGPPRYIDGSLPERDTLTIGIDSILIDFNTVFIEPDPDDSLVAFRASSSRPVVAEAEVSGTLLIVRPLMAGSAVITMTVLDSRSDSSAADFTVLVNRSPVVATTINDTSLTRNGADLLVNLAGVAPVFNDPDDDPLTYSAMSSDSQVAVAVVETGALLRVTPGDVNDGSAQISVTADDGRGGSASTDFTVTISGGPFVANDLADTTITYDGNPVSATRHLESATGNVFGHPDGVPLTYMANSDNPEVVATITGTRLLLTVNDDSDANITVTADDGRGGQAVDQFTLFVNERPQLIAAFPDTLVPITIGMPETFILSEFFLDDDAGDTLHFSAISENAAIIDATIASDSILVVSGQTAATDTVTIVVTADDRRGGVLADSFTTRINRSPEIIPGRSIPDTALTIGGNLFRYELADPATQIFEDPDGDALFYSAVSTNDSVALPLVFGSQLSVVAANRPGIAEIAVTATDRRGGSAQITFNAIVAPNRPPHIVIDRENTTEIAQAGQVVVVQAQVTKVESDVGIDSVNIFYRAGGETEFQQERMASIESLYFGTIPAAGVTEQGLAYYVEAVDALGASSRRPGGDSLFYSIPVQLPLGLTNPSTQPAADAANGYRLISFPLLLDRPEPQAILADELGNYDVTRWRFVANGPDGRLIEFPDIPEVQTGISYWLLTKTGARINSGPGQVLSIDRDFAVVLISGWNTVGNPFNFDLPLSSTFIIDAAGDTIAGSELIYRSYQGSWNNTATVPVTDLSPFEGYALFVDPALMPARLYFDPDVSNRLTKKKANATDGKFTGNDWLIAFEARKGLAADVDNVAAVHRQANDGWERFDHREPPGVGDFVRAYFRDPAQMDSDEYATDIRSPFEDGSEWLFEISVLTSGAVELTAAGLQGVPEFFEVRLVDPLTLEVIDLRRQPQTTFSVHAGYPRALRLLVGTSDYIQQKLSDFNAVPQAFALQQNFPNPFNPVTTIRYALPVDGRVTVTVFNMLGQKVVTLLDNQTQTAGYHSLLWDGRDAAGRRVASGVYFYQLNSGSFTQTRKMLLLE